MIPSCAWPAKTVGQSGACGRAANSNSGMKAIMRRCLLCGLEHPHAMEGESQIAALPIKSIHLPSRARSVWTKTPSKSTSRRCVRERKFSRSGFAMTENVTGWQTASTASERRARSDAEKSKRRFVQGTYADMEACWRAVIQAINDDLLK